MTTADLRDLHALLARAARADGLDPQTRADYAQLRDVVAELAGRRLAPAERERLELNADLPQLHFHLAEELRAGRADPGSLEFMRRHVVRLLAEYRDREHERLDPLDAELLLRLARMTKATYEQRFAAHYERAGYRRPFVDKLYRDYALTGIPDGLLLTLQRFAATDAVVLCVLKGALPYVLLMRLLGLPGERLRYVAAGRSTGSHIAPEYAVQPLGFELRELQGKDVLVVDNNAATGATLAHLHQALPPARTTLLLDYTLQPLPALAALFDEIVCGPFEGGDAGALKRRLVAAMR